ncbi:MAG TPA: hypothetical protein VFN74_09650 [Chloroflexota bacterium]|nr:hypothetical protein [Chloroflexota bacterium]
MSQTNVNAGGSGGVVERDGSAAGMGMGMIMAIVLGVALLALVAWYAIFQSGWFGPAYAPGGSTNVNITQNQPSNPAGQSGQSGSTTGGSTTGGTTGGSTTGGSTGAGR